MGGSFWHLGSFLQEPFKFADGILKVSVLGTRTLGGDHQLSSLVNAGLELEGEREIHKGWEVRGGRREGSRGGRDRRDWRKERCRKGWSGGNIKEED